MTRSLLASLDRMAVDEARRCSQALLQRVFDVYGHCDHGGRFHPPEIQEFIAGLVAYGADVSGTVESLSTMDQYFVRHWWEMLGPLLPEVSTTTTSVVVPPEPVGSTRDGLTAMEEVVNAVTPATQVWPLELEGTSLTQAIDLTGSAGSTTGTCGAQGVTELSCNESRKPTEGTTLQGTDSEGVAARAVQGPGHAEPAPVESGKEDNLQEVSHDMQAAMLRACEEYKAAQYRDWEEWECARAMTSTSEYAGDSTSGGER